MPQRQKRHVDFLCDFCAISRGCKAAARHARELQDCCTAHKVFVQLTKESPTHAFVLRRPQDRRALTLRFIARLPKNAAKRTTTAENRTMVAQLHCGYYTTSRFKSCWQSCFARPSCGSLACESEIILRKLYCTLTLRFIARLPKNAAKRTTTAEIAQWSHTCTAGTVRRLASSLVGSLALHDHLAAALHANVR